MQKLVLSGVCVASLLSIVACGGSSPDQKGFDNGAAGATSGSGGSGGTSSNAPYPAGPYGADIGSTVRNLQFLGWDNPQAANYDPTQFKTLNFSDFYNPDGTKPAKLLMINVSARWCVVCKGEYSNFRASSKYETYKAKGVEFIGVLFEDDNYKAAQPADMTWWTQTYQVAFPFVLDPGFKMGEYFNADATPLNLIVDAKTMQIKGKVLGYDPSSTDMWDQLDSLLAAQ